MMEFFYRELGNKDSKALLQLILDEYEHNRVLQKILNFKPTMKEIQQQTFKDIDYEPNLLIGAFKDEILIGCIMGVRRPWKENKKNVGWIKFILVAESYRRQKIGTQLMNLCEKYLENNNIKIILYGSSSPLYIFPGILVGKKSLQQFFFNNNWKLTSRRISSLFHLSDLDELGNIDSIINEIEFKNSIKIVDGKAFDTTKILSFIENNFSKSWAVETSFAFNRNDGVVSIALAGDQIVGFSAINATNTNWFGPMGVHQEWRKKDIGKILTLHSLIKYQKLENYKQSVLFSWINDSEVFYTKVLKNIDLIHFIKSEKLISKT